MKSENTDSRQVRFKSAELIALMQERGELITKGRDLTNKLEKLEKQRNKVALQADKLSSKMRPTLDKLVKPEVGEFEDVNNIEIQNGEVVVEIYDRLEDFKKQFRKAKEEQEKKAKAPNKAEKKEDK